MNVTIPKGDFNSPGPCWMSLSNSSGKVLKPIIKCECGTWCGIGLHHVHPDGTVTASFFHSKAEMPDGCDWHVSLTLADWTGAEFPPER